MKLGSNLLFAEIRNVGRTSFIGPLGIRASGIAPL